MTAGTQFATSSSTAVFFTALKALEQSVRMGQMPVSCSVLALNPTCSTPPDTATPNCLTSWCTSSNRGRHCRIAPAVMSLLHAIPTQTGRPFSPNAVRLDCKKSCQNSGGNASGSSTILVQKAAIGMRPYCSRIARVLFSSPSQSAIDRCGWDFHTVRGGVDPGGSVFVPGMLDL